MLASGFLNNSDIQSNALLSLSFRLKSLINQSDCMVFMKGSQDAPRCGFSKQLMAILAETG
jgi:glutaredoxin-related protein